MLCLWDLVSIQICHKTCLTKRKNTVFLDNWLASLRYCYWLLVEIGDFIIFILFFPLKSQDTRSFTTPPLWRFLDKLLCLIERALPAVCVFRQVPTGKHNCIPSSYFLSTSSDVYSQSPKIKSATIYALHRDFSIHLEIFFPFLSLFVFDIYIL